MEAYKGCPGCSLWVRVKGGWETTFVREEEKDPP